MAKRDNTRNKPSIQIQTHEQAHTKREFYKIKEKDGTYVSKPGKNACIQPQTLHKFFFIITENKILENRLRRVKRL